MCLGELLSMRKLCDPYHKERASHWSVLDISDYNNEGVSAFAGVLLLTTIKKLPENQGQRNRITLYNECPVAKICKINLQLN